MPSRASRYDTAVRILLSILFILLCGLTASGEEPRLKFDGKRQMTATLVPLDSSQPERRTVGKLTYLGGVRLTSPLWAFGGFSSMQVRGDHFSLLSDGGHVVQFRMGSDLHPFDLHFGALSAGPGTGWSKIDRDSESQTVDPATGQTWVGFEATNAIWRYDAAGRPQAHAEPKVMADWSVNGGPESLVRLRNGRFLTISETSRPPHGKDKRIGVIFAGDPTDPRVGWSKFAYQPPVGYDPTDMTELPDGRFLVLNRRATIADLFTAKLVLIDRADIKPGGTAIGREIATFAAPLLHDNFEALAVTQEEGATIVWIASDDNREWFEQSLLLKFRLDLP